MVPVYRIEGYQIWKKIKFPIFNIVLNYQQDK